MRARNVAHLHFRRSGLALPYYGAKYRAKISLRSSGRARHVLVVCLRSFKIAAVLRRLAQRHGVHTETSGSYRGPDCGMVRLQAFAKRAVLRRHSWHARLAGSVRICFRSAGLRPAAAWIAWGWAAAHRAALRKLGHSRLAHHLDFVPSVHDNSRVFLRFGKAMVAVALVLTLGGHWALLQTMAWTAMLAGNLQSCSLHEAA